MLAARSPSLIVVAALSLVLAHGGADTLSAASERASCRDDARYSVLTPWVGEWRMVDEAGAALGVSRVRSILGGCAIEEVRQRPDGREDVGLTFLDLASGVWKQRWLSSLGSTGLFELTFEDDGVSVEGSAHTAEGGEARVRATIAPRSQGGFLETLEISTDGGETYGAPLVTLYLPPGAASAAPLTEAAPGRAEVAATDATEPAPPVASGVKVRSERKARAPIPETAMESPMTLEVELGPLADLPPGAAWRTTELAPYVADQVNITQITAQSHERKGNTELELVVNLRTRVGKSKVDLDVTLLSGEASVASERVEGINLGKLIRAHDSQDGFPQTVRLRLDSDVFAALFANGKRPAVELTVTVH